MGPPSSSSSSARPTDGSSSLQHQLTVIGKLLANQQTVRVDQITSLLNENVDSETSQLVHNLNMQLLLAAASKNPQLNSNISSSGSNASSSNLDPNEAVFLPGNGRSWSENGADSTTLEPVCGGSLATEGVRTALAQLLNFYGINVNGLENAIGHHQTQSNGGKWF